MSPKGKRVFKTVSAISIVLIILLTTLIYRYYIDLKRTLIVKISSEATSLIGQKVSIGNLSFSPSAGINLYDIAIENPRDFSSGHLMKIKRLYFNINFSELFSGRYHFKNITVYSPELTRVTDKNGRMNISEKLISFFKKESKTKYRVDEFDLDSGIFDFNKDERFKNNNIDLSFKNVSSDPDTKTLISGSVLFAGDNRIKIEGWAILNNKPKRLNVSVSTWDIPLSVLEVIFYGHKISAEKAKIKMGLQMEGDTENGVNFRSLFQIRNAGYSFLQKEVKDIRLSADAFFNIRDNSILIKDLSLFSGDLLSVGSTAFITNIGRNAAYSGEVKINRIDLSAFNII